ncbi:MAG: M23 family metallopeptidase [Gemmatimonadales bacterium]
MRATRRTVAALVLLAIACRAEGPTDPLVPSFASSAACSTCAPVIQRFVKPFVGEFPAVNLFDHNKPKEFVDTNGIFLFTWGEVVRIGTSLDGPIQIDGHDGYDWKMPIGTPIRAVAPGTVVGIVNGDPNATCPFPAPELTLKKKVVIEHNIGGGIVVRSVYVHLSQIGVSLGQTVASGQQLGLSGQTGCAKGPHLHFSVVRMTQTNNGQPAVIDPYGWTSTATDRWQAAPDGAQSIYLWNTGQEPTRRLTVERPIDAGVNAGITSVAWLGPNDATTPNNEELVLSFAGSAGQVFTVDSLKSDVAGLRFKFPAGTTISATRPRLHVFTGTGTGNDTTVFMGRPSGTWDNAFNDCARLRFANGNVVVFGLGNGCP